MQLNKNDFLGGLNVIYMKKCMCVFYVLVKNAELFRRGLKDCSLLMILTQKFMCYPFLQSMKLQQTISPLLDARYLVCIIQYKEYCFGQYDFGNVYNFFLKLDLSCCSTSPSSRYKFDAEIRALLTAQIGSTQWFLNEMAVLYYK